MHLRIEKERRKHFSLLNISRNKIRIFRSETKASRMYLGNEAKIANLLIIFKSDSSFEPQNVNNVGLREESTRQPAQGYATKRRGQKTRGN